MHVNSEESLLPHHTPFHLKFLTPHANMRKNALQAKRDALGQFVPPLFPENVVVDSQVELPDWGGMKMMVVGIVKSVPSLPRFKLGEQSPAKFLDTKTWLG